MRLWKYIIGYAALVVASRAAYLSAEALKARETFEVGLQVVAREGKQSLDAIGDEYLQQLRKIEAEMQASGQFRVLVNIHQELVRFDKARVFTGRPVAEPVELREAQAAAQFKLLQTNYSNEFKLVKLAERYVQELAAAREAEVRRGNTASVRILDEERNRVLGLAALLRALESTKVPPPASVEAFANMTSEVIVESDRPRRQLYVFRPSNEPLQAMIGYTLKVLLIEDVSKLKVPNRLQSAGTIAHAISGTVGYLPRITLACQHGEIPSGSRLIIEYYSQSLTERSRRRESVEQIVLPRLDRGESYTVDAKGVQIYRSESVYSTRGYAVSKSSAGAEFYGLILHVVDPDRRVLVQRFSPQSLEREVAATPPEK
jgi:hypothetical protein